MKEKGLRLIETVWDVGIKSDDNVPIDRWAYIYINVRENKHVGAWYKLRLHQNAIRNETEQSGNKKLKKAKYKETNSNKTQTYIRFDTHTPSIYLSHCLILGIKDYIYMNCHCCNLCLANSRLRSLFNSREQIHYAVCVASVVAHSRTVYDVCIFEYITYIHVVCVCFWLLSLALLPRYKYKCAHTHSVKMLTSSALSKRKDFLCFGAALARIALYFTTR